MAGCVVASGGASSPPRPCRGAAKERTTSGQRAGKERSPSAVGGRWRCRRRSLAVLPVLGWRRWARASPALASAALPSRRPEHRAAGDGTDTEGRTARTPGALRPKPHQGGGGGDGGAPKGAPTRRRCRRGGRGRKARTERRAARRGRHGTRRDGAQGQRRGRGGRGKSGAKVAPTAASRGRTAPPTTADGTANDRRRHRQRPPTADGKRSLSAPCSLLRRSFCAPRRGRRGLEARADSSHHPTVKLS